MDMESVPLNIRTWQLSLGFADTNVMYALVKSGVIEQLRSTSKTLKQLAETCNLNNDVLFRLLRYAKLRGLVSFEPQSEDDNEYQISLTEGGEFLLDNVPGSIYKELLLMGSESWQKSWNNLMSSLQTGESAFTHVMGMPFFEYLKVNPSQADLFNSSMTANTKAAAKIIAEAYDFSSFKTVCDVAGGQGELLKGILSANPNIYGILYDMEDVVKDHVLGEFKDRATVQAGNFFESIPEADCIIMKRVIHDWNDDKASQILNVCKNVMKADTKLLLLERVITEKYDNEYSALPDLFFDLHMLIMAGGKERSKKQFETLLQKSGLKLDRIIPTKSSSMILEITKYS